MGRPRNDSVVRNLGDLVHLGRADLVSYSRWPLLYRGAYSLWKWQALCQAEIQRAYEAKLADMAQPHLALLAPSEHGKTYGIDIPFILWALGRNRNLRVGVCGSKDELAFNIGHGIDRLFKSRAAEFERFGLVPGYPWNAESKFLERDDDKLIHPSLMFFGPGNELQGIRFDIIVMSDVFTMKNQKTPESRLSLLHWMDETLFPRLEPWGFVLAEGHHVHEEDAYTVLKERTDEWKVSYQFGKSIIEHPTEENGRKAKVLAPEQWPYEKLMRIRARNPAIFELIYQNNPISREGYATREMVERCLDRSRRLFSVCDPDIKSAYKSVYGTLDPAFTANRRSAYSVFYVVGVTEDGRRDILAGWRRKLLPPQLKSLTVQTILDWDLDAFFVEANAAQVFLVHDVRAMLGNKAGLVKPVFTLNNNPDESVEAYVGRIVRMMEAGLYTIPYGDPLAREFADQLLTEIINFGTMRLKDCLLSLQIFERGLEALTKCVAVQTKHDGIRGRAFRRMGRYG